VGFIMMSIGLYYSFPRSAIKAPQEVKGVVTFDRSIEPTELKDLINNALVEHDGSILQKIDNLDKKLTRFLINFQHHKQLLQNNLSVV
jgi:hypothetical protein